MTNIEKLQKYLDQPEKYLVTYVGETVRAVYLRVNGSTDKKIELIDFAGELCVAK